MCKKQWIMWIMWIKKCIKLRMSKINVFYDKKRQKNIHIKIKKYPQAFKVVFHLKACG